MEMKFVLQNKEVENRKCAGCDKNINDRAKNYKMCWGCSNNDYMRRYNKRIGTTRRTRSSRKIMGVMG